ncbi:MAG: thioredoxin family protein, partial [Rudaea sp.]
MASRVSFDTPIQSSDQSFERVLNVGLPVAALFWSRAIPSDLESEMNARAKADAGKLLVVKIKTEDNPELVKRYNIRSTPTLILFRDGRDLTR